MVIEMKRNTSRRTWGALVLALAACTTSEDRRLPGEADAWLAGATRIEIFALDPMHEALYGTDSPESESLHGYRILGRAVLEDPAKCAELGGLIRRGIRESDGRVAACFNPRHGLRIERDSRELELVICFECLSMHAYGEALGTPGDNASALTSDSVEREVSRIFESAGLTIAPR